MSSLVASARSNDIPPQSFVPIFDFVDELIATDEDEGRVPYEGGKDNVGLLIYNLDDDDHENAFKVLKYVEKDGESHYVVAPIADLKDTQELEGDEIYDNWGTVPPAHVLDRWERYMNKRVGEGVWMAEADPSLITEINQIVDAFAVSEPVDHHPGTNGVVRDLVHPSLYPLIIDPASIDTQETNRWNRPYEQSRFQWLPAEVKIDADTKTAKFVSPINNLDAEKYPQLVAALEKTFSALVPGFENVFQYIETAVYDKEFQIGDGPEGYDIAQKQSFAGRTLQAVVKIADYEFAPGASFSGVWHYEGMAHENIAMTGLFYPYTDERLGGGLEFKRQFTDAEANKLLFGVSQIRPSWLNKTIDEAFVPLGWTSTETGKLMVFPNCHAHRVLEMVNRTDETLRRRLVVFFIVDPEKPIKSSAEYPPMPRKVSHEQALADRLELMQERKQAKQNLNPREIELCEH